MMRRLRFQSSTVPLLALVFAALFAQAGSQAQTTLPPDALPFTRVFTVTGGHVISGVDLPRGGGTALLNFNQELGNAIPANAVVVGAFVFWEVMQPPNTPTLQARFRGLPISTVKATRVLPPGSESNCWGSSGGAPRMATAFRADVLDMLPKHYDADNKWTGRYIVNDDELTANGLDLTSVTVGTPGSGNTLITVAGASLLLIYRVPPSSDPAVPPMPLRKIVLFDGAAPQAQGATTFQNFRGFFQSATSTADSAKVFMIVASGAGNLRERVTFNNTVLPVTNPIPDPAYSGSDRGWANPTFNVGALMPGVANATYGETATMSVDHTNVTPYECLNFIAMGMDVVIADGDNDGLPDGLEAATSGYRNPPTPAFPNGEPLPNIYGMGARKGQKDMLVEIVASKAQPGTSWGDVSAPYRSDLPVVTDAHGHDHMFPPPVIRTVGKGYADAGIKVRFDVGNTADYLAQFRASCPLNNAQCNDDVLQYLVPTAHARGGERFLERAFPGQFSFFPGTLAFPFGAQAVGDGITNSNGDELIPASGRTMVDALKAADPEYNGVFRRRYDRVRQDLVRLIVASHARGKASAEFPCLKNGKGVPCGPGTERNPLFYVPSPISGTAELPGNKGQVTLGLWDPQNFVGTVEGQAFTLFHELGHVLNLWHGGPEPIWGDKKAGTSTQVEPNCGPNRLTLMSYAHQMHGLWGNDGKPYADYSGKALLTLNETNLSDGPLADAKFRPAYFVPFGSSIATAQEARKARRYCSGAPFTGADPQMARVVADSITDPIFWDGNPAAPDGGSHDVNFDGGKGLLHGYDDWANVRLNQIGAGRTVRIFEKWSLDANGQPVNEGELLDFATGELIDFGTGELLDFATGENANGELIDFGQGTHIVNLATGNSFEYGSGELIDFGTGELLDFSSGDVINVGSGISVNLGAQPADPTNAPGELIDFGTGELIDFGTGELIDFGTGELLDFATGELIDFGTGELIDFGTGELIDFGTGVPELDFNTAFEMEAPRPYGVTACVLGGTTAENGCTGSQPAPNAPTYHRIQLNWSGPTFALPSAYEIYAQIGSTTWLVDTLSAPNKQTAPPTSYIVSEELPNGVTAIFWIKAKYPDGSISAKSVPPATIGTVNYVPPAVDDPQYIAFTGNKPIVVPAAQGVLINDNVDVDSPNWPLSRRLVRITQQPTLGTLTPRADGGFDYLPNPNTLEGQVDMFKYEVDNGFWLRNTSIPLNNTTPLNQGTVTITIKKKGK